LSFTSNDGEMRGMKSSKGMSRAEWVTGSLAAMVLGLTLSAALGQTTPLMAKKTKTISHCRQVIVALKIYASDHGGNYPSPDGLVSSSNQAFRRLFREEVVDGEFVFGCPGSIFIPDNNIGQGPGYAEALAPGENHWAMTEGLTDSSSGHIPLVYENPVKAEWPPKWKTSTGGMRKKGEGWSDGTVIVGMNDGGAFSRNLSAAKTGEASRLEPLGAGQEVFEPKEQHTILDIEELKEKP
jgi:hypothetical protein